MRSGSAIAERLQDSLDWPSLCTSLGLHLIVLAIFSTTLRGCVVTPRSDAPGSPSDWIESTIVVSESDELAEASVAVELPPAPIETADSQPTDNAAEQRVDEPEPDTALASSATTQAAERELPPTEETSFLRPLSAAEAARPSPSAAAATADQPSRTGRDRRSVPARRSATLPTAETGLFGITDRGNRLLYVIDRSSSMGDDNAMRAAKAELIASLKRLEPTQQFQVLFYNTGLSPLQPPVGAASREGMFSGQPEHRRRATQQIENVSPAGGTRHREPLLTALNYQPDVIFFLTDGDLPGLTAAELRDLRRRNGGRCRIHCIEFGRGRPIAREFGFLAKLAADNGGQYAYRDTTKF